jgi:hypothetical protein
MEKVHMRFRTVILGLLIISPWATHGFFDLMGSNSRTLGAVSQHNPVLQNAPFHLFAYTAVPWQIPHLQTVELGFRYAGVGRYMQIHYARLGLDSIYYEQELQGVVYGEYKKIYARINGKVNHAKTALWQSYGALGGARLGIQPLPNLYVGVHNYGLLYTGSYYPQYSTAQWQTLGHISLCKTEYYCMEWQYPLKSKSIGGTLVQIIYIKNIEVSIAVQQDPLLWSASLRVHWQTIWGEGTIIQHSELGHSIVKGAGVAIGGGKIDPGFIE